MSGDKGLVYQRVDEAERGSWSAPVPRQPDGKLIAIAAPSRSPLFAAVSTGSDVMLYITNVNDWNWLPLGKLGFVLKSMSGWDTKLFAIDEDNQVYCRESCPIDLVWTRIARGPEGQQLNLSAYFGRLMVLVENHGKMIMWRTATSTYGSIEPLLLFCPYQW